jgi:flagellar export protein FliJ
MEEAHLATLEQKMSDELAAPGSPGRIEASQFLRSVYYQHRLKQDMSVQHSMIAKARRDEAERREELLQAAKEEKVYAKLKERQRERYLVELERDEQKTTDEIAKNVFLGRTSD